MIKLLVVGEKPTALEDFLDEKFSTRAGQNIRRLVAEAGITDVEYEYIGDNEVKFWKKTIKLDPKLYLALGKNVASVLLNEKPSKIKLDGKKISVSALGMP